MPQVKLDSGHEPAWGEASAMELAVEDLLDLAALSPKASPQAKCDCGSGLTYARCCLNRDAALGRMLRNQSDAVDEVLSYWGNATQASAGGHSVLAPDILQDQVLREAPMGALDAPSNNKKIEPFDQHFAQVAENDRIEFSGRVTLNFAPLDGAKGTTAGSPGWRKEILKRKFVVREFYCTDPNCPCERVTLEVGTDWEGLNEELVPPLAVIRKGLFPDRKDWTAVLDPKSVEKLTPSAHEIAKEVLAQVNQLLATDPSVILRLRNHYNYIKQWSMVEADSLQ